MTCSLHSKLNTAYLAAREAFDEAHKQDALEDGTLNLLFVYYQGIKKIKEELPEHNDHDSISFSVSDADGILPDGCYDPDSNINIDFGAVAGEPVVFNTPYPGGAGEDIVTFS